MPYVPAYVPSAHVYKRARPRGHRRFVGLIAAALSHRGAVGAVVMVALALAALPAVFATGAAFLNHAVRPAAVSGFTGQASPRQPLTVSAAALNASDPGVIGQAAVLVDLDTHQVLWARDPDTPRAPASLTKMMTAMVALDIASPDTVVTVPAAATQVEPSLMGVSAGEKLTVRELLYGLFLNSGNDAAEALAGGLEPRDRFIRQMNAKAVKLGMRESHFANPSGLDQDGHEMSALDIAVAAMTIEQKYPLLAQIAATKEIEIPSTATHKEFHPVNLNRLLWTYPGAIGLKTGLTDNAGGCAVGVAQRNGQTLLVVVLNSTGTSQADAATLLDYGFAELKV